jgi:glycosyltransferase involved in cell wall biosynthesis
MLGSCVRSASPSSASLQMPRHIVVVGGLDPDDDETWSGTPKAIVTALRQQGHRVSTIGPLPKVEAGWPRFNATLNKIGGKTYLPIRDLAAVRRRVAPLNTALRAAEPYDCVVAWHAADGAIVRASAPLILVQDSTFLRLLDFYPGYERERLTETTIQNGIAMDRAALANCAKVIYSSHWAADSAREDYGVAPEKIIVQPFGANLHALPTDEAVRKAIAQRGTGPCRLVFVGVAWQRKGGDLAVAVAQELNDRGIACELDLIGSHPTSDLPGWVRRYGYLPRRDPQSMTRLAELLARSDFMILPSRADCTPIVLSEAAACGLPVATTAVGGIAEIVGNSGWAKAFAPASQAAPIADWIEHAYRDRAHYEQMALKALNEYKIRLNWTTFARTLMTGLERLGPRAAARTETELSGTVT